MRAYAICTQWHSCDCVLLSFLWQAPRSGYWFKFAAAENTIHGRIWLNSESFWLAGTEQGAQSQCPERTMEGITAATGGTEHVGDETTTAPGGAARTIKNL